MFGIIHVLYGIDYDEVAKNSKGVKLIRLPWTTTEIFATEDELIARLKELEIDEGVDDVRPFVTKLQREEYTLEIE